MLEFRYPRCRNITDCRLWSEINGDLKIINRNYESGIYKLKIIVFKKLGGYSYNNKTTSLYKRKKYFNNEYLYAIGELILRKWGFNTVKIIDMEVVESYQFHDPYIKLELIKLVEGA